MSILVKEGANGEESLFPAILVGCCRFLYVGSGDTELVEHTTKDLLFKESSQSWSLGQESSVFYDPSFSLLGHVNDFVELTAAEPLFKFYRIDIGIERRV